MPARSAPRCSCSGSFRRRARLRRRRRRQPLSPNLTVSRRIANLPAGASKRDLGLLGRPCGHHDLYVVVARGNGNECALDEGWIGGVPGWIAAEHGPARALAIDIAPDPIGIETLN